MMVTVALWPSKSDFSSRPLLGRPIWRRALDAAESLGARRTLWLGAAPPDGVLSGMDVVQPRELFAVRDTIAILPAELALLTAPTLKALVKRGRSRPASVSLPDNPRAAVIAAPSRDWKRALSGFVAPTFAETVKRLSPVSRPPAEAEELLVVDSTETWAAAARALRRRKVGELVRRGVLVSDPDQVLVDPEVSVGAGTRLLPWVHLEGSTRIGRDAVISSFCHVVDSVIGTGTVVLDHCFIRESRIGKNVSIGPFAHLRPHSVVGAQAKVGNFVELKNTRLGAGAKAPHLSYLGDATIGKGSNVGAGTITCNYDGEKKHRTVVGDGAFIGSDVQLVAPVRVGKGAYVAAGSCIVEDVPAGALALARSRQVVKKGWAASRRQRKAKG